MKFFRAIAKDLKNQEKYFKHKTFRLPSNVPYFVDNIWEYFRPEDKPSRRFAVYASPTTQLALQNASQAMYHDVYELEFSMPAKHMQLSVTDARYHPDIRNLQKLINDYAYKLDLDQKKMISLLFIPGISRQEIQDNMSPLMDKILSEAKKAVTIWNDVPVENGEFFFELDDEDKHYYILKSVT